MSEQVPFDRKLLLKLLGFVERVEQSHEGWPAAKP